MHDNEETGRLCEQGGVVPSCVFVFLQCNNKVHIEPYKMRQMCHFQQIDLEFGPAFA